MAEAVEAPVTRSFQLVEPADDFQQFLPQAEAAIEKWNSSSENTQVKLVRILHVYFQIYDFYGTKAFMVLQVTGVQLTVVYTLLAVVVTDRTGKITVENVRMAEVTLQAQPEAVSDAPGPREIPLEPFPCSPTDPGVLRAAHFAVTQAPGFGMGASLAEVCDASCTLYVPFPLVEYNMLIKVNVVVSLRPFIKPLVMYMQVVVDERVNQEYSLVSSKLAEPPRHPKLGAPVPISVTDPGVIAAANFGVAHVGEKFGAVGLMQIRSAMVQVVAGTVYYLVVDASFPNFDGSGRVIVASLWMRVFQGLDGEYKLVYYEVNRLEDERIWLGTFYPIELTPKNEAILTAAGEFATTRISKDLHVKYGYAGFDNAMYQIVNGMNLSFVLKVTHDGGDDEFDVLVYFPPQPEQDPSRYQFELVRFSQKRD